MKFKLTRIAPTPSGMLHTGNAFNFLLTAEIAKITGAKLLLRIDDLDEARVRQEYIRDIFETLAVLEIKPDHGPRDAEDFKLYHSQKERVPFMNEIISNLISSGEVYACNCSRKDLAGAACSCKRKNFPLEDPGYSLRMCTKDVEKVQMKTLDQHTGLYSFPNEMHNFIVRKKDGMPSYQVASLADDIFYKVDLIIRGEDLWNSSLAQLYIAEVLGKHSFSRTTFHHHKLIINEKGEKLSKSAGNSTFRDGGKYEWNVSAIRELVQASLPSGTAQ